MRVILLLTARTPAAVYRFLQLVTCCQAAGFGEVRSEAGLQRFSGSGEVDGEALRFRSWRPGWPAPDWPEIPRAGESEPRFHDPGRPVPDWPEGLRAGESEPFRLRFRRSLAASSKERRSAVS